MYVANVYVVVRDAERYYSLSGGVGVEFRVGGGEREQVKQPSVNSIPSTAEMSRQWVYSPKPPSPARQQHTRTAGGMLLPSYNGYNPPTIPYTLYRHVYVQRYSTRLKKS